MSDFDQSFNNEHFKEIRKQALTNQPIKGCYKCDVEENSGIKSYRQHSNEAFVLDRKTLTENITTKDIKYVEYFVGNQCNLKCISCHPKFSTKWREDYQNLKWDPKSEEVVWSDRLFHLAEFSNLERVKILGGEPFLLKSSHQMFKGLSVDALNKLELWYHTNATVLPTKELIEVWKKCRQTRIYLSVDGYGKLNEYLRFPSQWSEIDKNVKEFFKLSREVPSMTLTLQVTVSNGNLFSLSDLYNWFQEISRTFYPNERVRANFQPVFDPAFLSPTNLPDLAFAQALKKLSAENSVFFALIRQLQQMPKSPFDTRVFKYLKDLEGLRKNNIQDVVPEWRELIEGSLA